MAHESEKVFEFLAPLMHEFGLQLAPGFGVPEVSGLPPPPEGYAVLYLGGSKAPVKPGSSSQLLNGEILVVEVRNDVWDGYDLESFLLWEREYASTVNSAIELYAKPLLRAEIITNSEYNVLFLNLHSISEASMRLCERLQSYLEAGLLKRNNNIDSQSICSNKRGEDESRSMLDELVQEGLLTQRDVDISSQSYYAVDEITEEHLMREKEGYETDLSSNRSSASVPKIVLNSPTEDDSPAFLSLPSPLLSDLVLKNDGKPNHCCTDHKITATISENIWANVKWNFFDEDGCAKEDATLKPELSPTYDSIRKLERSHSESIISSPFSMVAFEDIYESLDNLNAKCEATSQMTTPYESIEDIYDSINNSNGIGRDITQRKSISECTNITSSDDAAMNIYENLLMVRESSLRSAKSESFVSCISSLHSESKVYDTSSESTNTASGKMFMQYLPERRVSTPGPDSEFSEAKENQILLNQLFNGDLMDTYEDFIGMYPDARQLLREKIKKDEHFTALLDIRRGAALYSVADYLDLPIERLAQYERLVGSGGAVTVGRRRAQRQSDLERVQDLFPNDYLALYEPDVVAVTANNMKMKTLLRKRPSLDSGLAGGINGGSATMGMVTSPSRAPLRQFLMEAPCQLATAPGDDACLSGSQIQTNFQERHLFLFTDLLVLAKSRATNCFKLKECVRVSELWVSLSGATGDTSFVLGWPLVAGTSTTANGTSAVIANNLVTYPTQAARDTWFRKIQNALNVQLAMEPKSTNIQIVYKDSISGVEFCKTVTVTPEMTTSIVIRQALQILQNNNEDTESGQGSLGPVKDYTLWAKITRDGVAVPLIGSERPHAIQMSRIRQTISNEEGFDLEHVNSKNNPCGMIFELKKINKNIVKSSRTPLKLFRRASAGRLWGVPLVRLCPSGRAPPPVLAMLRILFRRGPSTQGIFRRSANAKALKVLKEKIDNLGPTNVRFPDIENAPVLLVAALFKDFLRNLPQPLLCDNLYNNWISVLAIASTERVAAVRTLLLKMPKAHYNLLSYFVSLLQAIARKSSINLMCPMNLGVCVGPSLLWPPTPCDKAPKAVPALIELLILHAETLFGPQLNNLFGKGSPEPSASISLDSGAEESDSLHSVGLSLDSLDLTCPRKEKLSLSRDSGLTMSEDDSNSNGGNSPAPRNGQQIQTEQKNMVHTEQAQRVYAKCYTTEVHNVSGLPKLTVKSYKCDTQNIYGCIVEDDIYCRIQQREPIYGKSKQDSSKRYSTNTQSHVIHDNIYGSKIPNKDAAKMKDANLNTHSPAKYITGLEPEKPPRVLVSKAARNTKATSVYVDNTESNNHNSPARLYSRAKSSEDLLGKSSKRNANNCANVYEFQQCTQVAKQKLQRSNNVLEKDPKVLTPGYSRVYSGWEPRILNYSNPSNRHNISMYSENTINHLKQGLGQLIRSQENLLDLCANEKHLYDFHRKAEHRTTEEAKTFARNDWTRQASRTKSLETNNFDCPYSQKEYQNDCSAEFQSCDNSNSSDTYNYNSSPNTNKCNLRSVDPAHVCTGRCNLYSDEKSSPRRSDQNMIPLQNSYSMKNIAKNRNPSREVKKNAHSRQSLYGNVYDNQSFSNGKLPHSKSLANIVLHSDSSSSDTLYQPKNMSPYNMRSTDSPASSDNSFTKISMEYSEPIYLNGRNDHVDVFCEGIYGKSKGFTSGIYSAKPTCIDPDFDNGYRLPSNDAAIARNHIPPPVPPRKLSQANILKKFPPVHVTADESKTRSKSIPPIYKEPPNNMKKHGSGTDTKNNSNSKFYLDNPSEKYVLALDGSGTDTESESYV